MTKEIQMKAMQEFGLNSLSLYGINFEQKESVLTKYFSFRREMGSLPTGNSNNRYILNLPKPFRRMQRTIQMVKFLQMKSTCFQGATNLLDIKGSMLCSVYTGLTKNLFRESFADPAVL